MSLRRLSILYGSQTGWAQDLAEQIYRESKLYHFSARVSSMDEYNIQNLINETLAVFVCSTTGQGDEPDNMKLFWKFLLRKNLPHDSLNGLHFACLGLGDSSYSKFNFVAKRLCRRLEQLGGRQIIPIGLCDDQHDLGISATSVPWLANLWQHLLILSPLPNGLTKLDTIPNQFKWEINVIDDDKENNCRLKPDNVDIYDYSTETAFEKPFIGKVVSNIRTTAVDHFQDVRLISFKPINDSVWSPGDVVCLRPRNSQANIDKLFHLFSEHNLGLYPETIVAVSELDSEMPVPQYLSVPLSLKTIATQLWDLNAIPRPRSFEILSINCENELEKEKLFEFTTAEGQQDLFSYANRPRRTILEVLEDFPHATSKLTLNLLFELFQSIRLRSFSIASCRETNLLDILVAVVEYKTILHTPRKGLCSNWLKELKVNTSICGFIKRGTFAVPNDRPLIMIGPGTGLAPFRSILQQKQHLKCVDNLWHILFFGCRNKHKDFHCQKELNKMEATGLIKLFTAFSRDQDDKIYVQHRIKEQSALLKELIKSLNASIFVAGNSKNMPQSVREALTTIVGNDTGYIETMIKTGRYQEETWS